MSPLSNCIFLLLSLSLMLSIATREIVAKRCNKRVHDQLFFEEDEVDDDESPDGGDQKVELLEDCGRFEGSFTRRRISYYQHPRIYNGYDAKSGQFPSFVELQLPFKLDEDGNSGTSCGGTIITSKHILTAAHCFDSKPNLAKTKVGIGLKSYKDNGDKDFEIEGAEKFCISSKYHLKIQNRRRLFQDDSELPFAIYDVAILKLASNIEFSDTIWPACLPKPGEPLTQDRQAYSIGIGYIIIDPTTKESERADYLQVLPVSKVDCHEQDQHESVMCSKFNNADHTGSVCQGDSGGPVLALNAEGRQTVYGIHSYGTSACGPFELQNETGYTSHSYYIGKSADVHNIREEIDRLLEECA